MEIWIYILVGFTAQIIDGSLGMAYGVSSTAFLLSIGIPSALASASVHTAEIFTTLVSGLSHLKLGNVDKSLFKRLLIPGVLGGILGAFVLSNFPGDVLKPYIAIYLLIMGMVVLNKALRKARTEAPDLGKKTILLGFFGGLMDALGGGGWGPIVTSTLVARGKPAHLSIGTVSLSEFFVTVAQVTTFAIFLKLTHWQIILGLIIGGVIAAPLAAWLCKRINTQKLMLAVGILIIFLSLRTLWLTLSK